MKVIQTYSSPECNTFEVFNDNKVLIAYYYEHFDTTDGNVVYECYYDFENVNDITSSTSSYVLDSKEELSTLLEEIEEKCYFDWWNVIL